MISVVPFGIASAISATGQDIVIALQMIGIKSALAVNERDTPPKKMGGGAIARAERIAHDLAGATQGPP